MDLDTQPQFELPRPRPPEKQAREAIDKEERQYEKRSENQNHPAGQPQTSSTLPQTSTVNPFLAAMPPAHAQPSVAAAPPLASIIPAPDMADDVDLIEKEWVVRAKDIVERTKNDPHMQNKEINKFKAEYIKKRYNKELKLSDE